MIRLGFAKMRCFAAVSCVLLVLLVLVNMLIYNIINAFVVVWLVIIYRTLLDKISLDV